MKFEADVKNTNIYKDVKSCRCDFDLRFSNLSQSDIDKISFNIWVDSWTHQLTKVDILGDFNDITLSSVIYPEFNKNFQIVVPEDTVLFDDSFVNDFYNTINMNYLYNSQKYTDPLPYFEEDDKTDSSSSEIEYSISVRN